MQVLPTCGAGGNVSPSLCRDVGEGPDKGELSGMTPGSPLSCCEMA